MTRLSEMRRLQLGTFFWEVEKIYRTFAIAPHENVEWDKAIFQIGKPGKLNVRFYDYTETRGGEVDKEKAPHLQWTLKDGPMVQPVPAEDRSLTEIVKYFKATLEGIFLRDYEALKSNELRESITQAGNELIFRGNTKQLRFTFLEGDTVHGHAYIEPLTAPVQIA